MQHSRLGVPSINRASAFVIGFLQFRAMIAGPAGAVANAPHEGGSCSEHQNSGKSLGSELLAKRQQSAGDVDSVQHKTCIVMTGSGRKG